MSEFQVTLRGGSRVERVASPAEAEACGRAVPLGRPTITTDDGQAIAFLKRVASFPVMLATLLIGAVFVPSRGFFVDPDLWWHIKNGQNILTTHKWPNTDPFSFTVGGQPWISTEWLGDVILATVAGRGGLQGLEALLIALGGSIMVALYVCATLRAHNSKAGFVAAVILFPLAAASFSLRPQMLGYVFLIVTITLLERCRQGKCKGLWFLPPLFLIWVNTHGSFVIGMAAIAAYWAGGLLEFRLGDAVSRTWSSSERLRLEIVFLLCLIALLLTPYGSQMAFYPFHVASSLPMGVANVMEWQSMPFNLAGGKLFLAILLSFFFIQVLFQFSWRLEEFGLFLFGTMMACLHVRFLLVFVPFFAPLLAAIVARWIPRYERSKDRYMLNAVLMALVLAGVLWYFPSNPVLERTVAKSFPVAAVEYLRKNPVPSPMFNTYGFGGYLIWSDRKVFVDGRADPYERGGVLGDYFGVARLEPSALAILKTYGIRSCLLERKEPLATVLGALPQWRQVYADNVAILFVRQDGTPLASHLSPGSPLEHKE